MKKILMVAALSLSLTACNFFPGSGGGTQNTQLDQAVAQVRAFCEKACSFLPTVESVTAMLTANNPTVVGATAVAHAICNAIKTKPFTLYDDLYTKDSCPKVNGVCVDGEKKAPSSEPQSLISRCPMVNGVCVEGERK